MGFGNAHLIEHRLLANSDLYACNSAAEEKVKPVITGDGRIENKSGSTRLEINLPPASWNVIRLIP